MSDLYWLSTSQFNSIKTYFPYPHGKALTDDLTDAVDLVKIGATALGCQGGGRPDMAQAGGPDADSANDAVNAIEKALAS